MSKRERWTAEFRQGERAIVAPNGEPYWQSSFATGGKGDRHFALLCDQVEESNRASEPPHASEINDALSRLAQEWNSAFVRNELPPLGDAVDRLLKLIPSSGWPEPLPTMTGREIATLIQSNGLVEVADGCGGWVRARGVSWGSIPWLFVARVVEPATERVPWWEARGRRSASGERIAKVASSEGGKQ